MRWCRISSFHVSCIPQRRVMCILAVIGTIVGSMIYISGFKTFKEIIYKPIESQSFRTLSQGRCHHVPRTVDAQSKMYAKLYWSNSMISNLMQVFWLAFAVSNVASGLVVDAVGSRHIWGLGAVFSAVATTLSILLSTVNPNASIIILIVSGAGLGVIYPCYCTLIAFWVPTCERTITVAMIESGKIIGLCIEFVLHDNLSEWGGGWEMWVYVSCAISLVWVFFWYTLYYDHPAQDPHMDERELQYLRENTPGVLRMSHTRMKIPYAPWKEIITSASVWSLLSCNIAVSWAQGLIFYQMNQYLLNVFNLHSLMIPDEYVTGMALGIGLCSLIMHGWISDKLISSGLTGRTSNRRFFLLFPNYVSAGLLLAIPALGCRRNVVLLLFYTLIYLQAMTFGPLSANVVDLSPRHAGLIGGIISAGRGLSILFCRKLVEFLVDDLSDYTDWAIIFNTSAVLLIVLPFPYLFFGSGDIQEWNYMFRRKSTIISIVQSREMVSNSAPVREREADE